MEIEKRNNTPLHILLAALIGLSAAVEWLMPIMALLTASIIAMSGVRWGKAAFAVSFTIASAVSVLTHLGFDAAQPWLNAVTAFASICLPAAVIYFTLSRKGPYRLAVVVSAVITVAALYGRYAILDLLAGEAPFTAMKEALLAFGDGLAAYGAEIDQAETAETMAKAFRDTGDALPDVMLAIIIAIGITFAFINTVLCRLMCRKADIKPMARFKDWALSKNFTVGCIMLVGAAAVTGFTDMKYGLSLTLALMTAAMAPLALQGAALQVFLYSFRKAAWGMKALLIAMTVLFFPYSTFYYAVTGFIEQLIRLRRKLIIIKD